MFSLIYVWINGWVNYREAGDLRRRGAHYDVIVMNDDPFYLAVDNVIGHGLKLLSSSMGMLPLVT